MDDAALEGIERWLTVARAREAAEARVRERWLRQQTEDEAHMGDLLLDLAEAELDVIAACASGARHVGRIEAVGEDFVAVRAAGRRLVLVAFGALAFVRATGPRSASGRATGRDDGGTGRQIGVTMADVLAHAVADRPRVQVTTVDATVVGELRAVGVDVVTLHVDGDPPGVVYARLASVSEVSLLDSG